MKNARRKDFFPWLTVVALVAVVAVISCASLVSAKPPNILFILADDLGYGEVGVFPANSPHGRMPTPNLDQLRSEGMMFTSAYAGEAVCAPSRCTLMTGLHTGHAYIRGNIKVDGHDLPLPLNYTTVADVLKGAGYTTAAIGKWGLGYNGTVGAPRNHGFDYYYGQLDQTQCHDYYPPFVWENEDLIELPLNANNRPNRTFCMAQPDQCTYTHDLFTNKTFEWLMNQSNSETPFFLYLAYTIPHAGGWDSNYTETGEPVPSDLGVVNYTNPTWPTVELDHASMITNYLDRDIGRVLALLDELGMGNDTIVFFASDNGAMNEGGHNYTFFDSSGPLRGFKRSLYEGGIRSPSLVRWRGNIAANSTSDYYWAFWDFLPTAADIAGVSLPELPYALDGVSVLPTLLGQEQPSIPYLYWEFCTKNQWGHAVRAGQWKAVSFAVNETFQLYNILEDLGETNDLSSLYPDVVQNLTIIAKEAHTNSDLFPIENCVSS
eukprot:TRINITY_DN2708_c0_g1_i1.p1 TRINITY_DN2708_c0_g1~~TRINITY_DN2708_c0_g1_i1.p1  ORF type:complete len:503 (-),score=84.70 TRINITY_DN2708_c0_g1_i1:97-1569(-)